MTSNQERNEEIRRLARSGVKRKELYSLYPQLANGTINHITVGIKECLNLKYAPSENSRNNVCNTLDCFNSRSEGTSPFCRECQAEHVIPLNKKYVARNLEYVRNIKISRGCFRCGYNSEFVVLDFHHLGDNAFRLSAASTRSIESIDAEIAKCVVLCRNCHKLEHYVEPQMNERRALAQTYKKECNCCGNTDYRVLEFHHRDPKDKKYNIGALTSTQGKCVSLSTIKEEIEKCDVVCANCHRIIEHEIRSSNGSTQQI